MTCLDCVYVAASAHDARYTRICIASIRYFYPDIPIKLLAGGPLEPGLAEELAAFWNVGLADLPRGDWGWGFIKLEPLFFSPGEQFLVLDSDTVLAGPVLKLWESRAADFLVDDEQQSEADTHRLYYDWHKMALVDPAARPPQFVFNSGQWFGTSGILTRQDFALLVDWSSMPPRLLLRNFGHPSDQGILNYVFNQKHALDGLHVERQKLMRWPGHGLEGLSVDKIVTRQTPPLVIHWAGMKQARLGAMVGDDILRFFEKVYYDVVPSGLKKRLIRGLKYPINHHWKNLETLISLRLRSLGI